MIDRRFGLGWVGKAVGDRVQNLSFPTLGRVVELPVFMIHHTLDPEDYFFIFDFEDFVENSQTGVFVRPRLHIWSGRSDFDRKVFARQFRQSFAEEFERMRIELGAKKAGRGWLSWDWGVDVAGYAIANVTAYLVILIATGTGKALASLISLPDWMKGKSAEVKLENKVEDLKTRVDAALANIQISVHPELHSHAWLGRTPEATHHIDQEAWPLPGYVSEHLHDGRNGSWW